MSMYNIPTSGCNMEIMGYPFFAESVSPNESYNRRDYNFNNIVGGTMNVTPGSYIGLDFTVTTHVYVNPDRPDVHNSIFKEMMSKPVTVTSPELGGRFKAIVVVKSEHEQLDYLKLTFSIKEVPSSKSKIKGEKYSVPARRKVTKKKDSGKNGKKGNTGKTGKKTTPKVTSLKGKTKANAKKNKGGKASAK